MKLFVACNLYLVAIRWIIVLDFHWRNHEHTIQPEAAEVLWKGRGNTNKAVPLSLQKSTFMPYKHDTFLILKKSGGRLTQMLPVLWHLD